MTLPPLLVVLLSLPVLLGGEQLVRRVPVLGRMNLPAPVVGGLLVALLALGLQLAGALALAFTTQVSTGWWTWLVTIEPEWAARPLKSLSLPLLVTFYVSVGLNSTWSVVRQGSVQVLLFLAVATLLGVVQNLVGLAVAAGLGLPAPMGVLCGSLTMTGGHGTTLGFAPLFEAAGIKGAAVIGSTMATMGIVVGSIMGGPVGGWLIRRKKLKTETAAEPAPAGEVGAVAGKAHGDTARPRARRTLEARDRTGLGAELHALRAHGGRVLLHLLLMLAVVKGGAWATFFLQRTGLTFPMHIGTMLLGVAVRNLIDLFAPGWVRSEIIAPIGSVCLAFFLTIAMMSLNLAELAHAAVPMLVIFAVQIVVMIGFAIGVTFRAMGRDYEAAQMAVGHCGFGIGNTANAIASMKTLAEKYGPAPRAFLVIPLVGGMLGDLTNAVNVSLFLKWLG